MRKIIVRNFFAFLLVCFFLQIHLFQVSAEAGTIPSLSLQITNQDQISFSPGDEIQLDLILNSNSEAISNLDIVITVMDQSNQIVNLGQVAPLQNINQPVSLDGLEIQPPLDQVISTANNTGQIMIGVMNIQDELVLPVTAVNTERIIVSMIFRVLEQTDVSRLCFNFDTAESGAFSLEFDEPLYIEYNQTSAEVTPAVPSGEDSWMRYFYQPLAFAPMADGGSILCENQVYPECTDGCTAVGLFKRCLNIGQFLNLLIGWGILLAFLAAVIRLGIGIYKYITATGDASKLGEARSTIIFALGGLGVIAVTWLFLRLITYIVPSIWDSWFGVS